MANTRRKRMVILTVDTIGALLRDYIGEAIPQTATSLRLEFSAKDNGKLAIIFEDDNIAENSQDIYTHFDLKRVYTI